MPEDLQTAQILLTEPYEVGIISPFLDEEIKGQGG